MSNKTKYTYTDLIFMLCIALTSIILNLIYGYNTSSQGFGGVMLGIVDTFTFSAYILISRTPVLAEAVLLFAQIITFVYDMFAGATFKEAIEDTGFSIMITFVAFLIALKLAKVDTTKEKGLIGNIKNRILYDRKIHNIKWYYKIVIYSIIVTVIMNISNSSSLNTYISGTAWRAFAALTVVFQFIRVLSLISTTTFAYEIFGLYIVAEVFTVYMQYRVNNNVLVSVLFIIEEFVVLVYSIYRCNMLNKKEHVKNSSQD